MEDFDEDLIWDAITASAKSRIDYARFAALFPFNPDNFLSSIIYGFAVSRTSEGIAEKIAAQVFMTGNTVDLHVLTGFIEESRAPLNQEIALTAQALKMLVVAEGEDVYAMVSESLSS